MIKYKAMRNKVLAFAMTATMTVGMIPMTVLADTDVPVTMEDDVPDILPDADDGQEPYQYVYANLSWAEYWENEGIYLEEGYRLNESSDETDSRGELDKGAFDTVTRATKNHGIHRGSFQGDTVIYDANGKEYNISHWVDRNTVVLRDGRTIGFSGGTITYAVDDGEYTSEMVDYNVFGMKYVPVRVNTEDFEQFCSRYDVTLNGETVAGGFTENNLVSYEAVANVTEDTNGLKEATIYPDGSFTFSAARSGSDSGLMDVDQRSADGAEPVVREASGSYGEFLRVDINGDYGDLGSKMYAVRWDYYGDDSTYTTTPVSYGTKFAADNWMHRIMGIQLGLTESMRCQLPEGTDGTGFWELTVKAIGYEDFVFRFEATDEHIVKPEEDEIDTSAIEAIIAEAEALKEDDYTAESWTIMQAELAEAKEALEAKPSQAVIDEAVSHLRQAINDLVKKEVEEPVKVAKMVIAKAASNTYNSNRITWKQMQGVKGYRIYFRESGGKWQYLKEMKGTVTAYVHKGLKTGTEYTYYMRAFKEGKDGNRVYGAYSNPKKATPTLAKAKVTSVTSNTSKKITVKWSKLSGAYAYRIYYKTSAKGKWKYLKETKKTSYTYTNSKFKKGQTVYYRVRGYRMIDGKMIFGPYSAAKSVKIK